MTRKRLSIFGCHWFYILLLWKFLSYALARHISCYQSTGFISTFYATTSFSLPKNSTSFFRAKYPCYIVVVARVHFARFSNARKWKGERILPFLVHNTAKTLAKMTSEKTDVIYPSPKKTKFEQLRADHELFLQAFESKWVCFESKKDTQYFDQFRFIPLNGIVLHFLID